MTRAEVESWNPQICFTLLHKQQSSNEKLLKIISKQQEEKAANSFLGDDIQINSRA